MRSPIAPLAIRAYTLINAAGSGRDAVRAALLAGRSGLVPCDYEDAALATWIGRVADVEDMRLPPVLARYDCRNARLAWLALHADGLRAAALRLRARYGAARVGLFVGTTTSGIRQTEYAYAARASGAKLPSHLRHTHNPYALAALLRDALGLTGPALAISTACSSSAKAFASAERAIAAGLCDAALVGGVDSLCLTTLYGFRALDLLSPEPCRPWDAARRGISIGEAAGFALIERAQPGEDGLQLVGYGESSDAHHLSAPHPEGAGAVLAMQAALASAGLRADAVDYINLHGTATMSNDAAEDRAVRRVFGAGVACSSTKGMTGHTLGAAGITEALLCCLALETGFLPGTVHTRAIDPALGANLLLTGRAAPLRCALSNSFGFGGSNCSLVFARAA